MKIIRIIAILPIIALLCCGSNFLKPESSQPSALDPDIEKMISDDIQRIKDGEPDAEAFQCLVFTNALKFEDLNAEQKDHVAARCCEWFRGGRWGSNNPDAYEKAREALCDGASSYGAYHPHPPKR